MKPRNFVFIIIAFLVGGVGGGIVGSYVSTRVVSGYVENSTILGKAVDTQTKVGLLQKIRERNYNEAIELLEVTLDGDIVSLRINNENTNQTTEAVKKAITVARDYRTVYPRHTKYPDIDAEIMNILSKQNIE